MNESQAVTYKTLIKDASYGETGPDERTSLRTWISSTGSS